MRLGILWSSLILASVTACALAPAGAAPTPAAHETGMGMGMGMGMGSGMMARHMAAVPAEYAGRTSPAPAEAASLERGAALYVQHCAVCHGDGGQGDGPTAASLDPAPAPVAHTSQMMGDDYLFWRISEGGQPFQTAMPAWKDSLDEQARWDLIHYLRALGQGAVQPGHALGGSTDPAAHAAQQAALVDQAVQQGVITAAEAEIFNRVHAELEAWMAAAPASHTPAERQAAGLAALVAAGQITAADSETFQDVHLRLDQAGLMP